jgi:hypothetical protein
MFMEHFVGLRLLDELKHSAFATEGGSKLEEIFIRDFFLAQKAVGDRHSAERHEGGNRRIAHAATARKLALSGGH